MFNYVWDQLFSSRPWGKYPAEDLIRFVIREVSGSKSRQNLRALELGCGPGANLCLLANEDVAFDAIDGSETAVNQARQRLDAEHEGWRGRIVTGDFCRLPSDFINYDMVIDSEAIYCNSFEESKGIIKEVHARLRPGGAFWSRTFAPGTWGIESGEQIGPDYWLASEGPLAGKGPVRITPRHAVSELYGSDWAAITVGEITRHDGDPGHLVREWVIVARKSTGSD